MFATVNKNEEDKINFAKDSIAKLREKILVGSTNNRNKLINFKHQEKKRDQVRIVDEIIDKIYLDLIEGKEFIFKSLPEEQKELQDEQTQEFIDALEIAKREDKIFQKEISELGELYDGGNKESLKIERDLKDRVRKELKLHKRKTVEIIGIEEYAKIHGINPNYELTEKLTSELSAQHKDKYLQTILKPNDLNRKIESIKRLSRNALSEKGVNTLYLVFGFLEWVESENSDEKILSPLLLLPVEIDKKKKQNWYEFIMSAANTDIKINIALQAKLQKDFGIFLKDFEEEDTPEKYFDSLQKDISKKDRWKVKKFITLGHFYFAKMAMYYDLDPKNWKNLGSQQCLQDIFSGSSNEDGIVTEDYEVDEKEIYEKIPLLINNADASQFSAIVDVMNGKNIAIQGPPGTGKSQTIANIIAAALANDKKVLFCAEKKPALDVVYKKLLAADLGSFCLKISSSGIGKNQIIQDIKKRLDLNKKEFNENNYKIEKQKELEIKNDLILYKKILHSNISNSEIKISDIFGFVSKFSHVTTSNVFINIFNSGIDKLDKIFEKITPDEFILIANNLKNYEESSKSFLNKYKDINNHPWNGFINFKINPFEKKNIINQFNNLKDYIEKIENKIQSTISDFPEIKIFESLDCLKNIEIYLTKKITNFDKIQKYLYIFKSEEDLSIIKQLQNELDFIKEDLFFEKDILSKLNIKNSDFKKIKNIHTQISNSSFFSFFSKKYREAKNSYLKIKKNNDPYNKTKAISDLNLYIKYIEIYDKLTITKNKIRNNKNYYEVLGAIFKEENTNSEILSEIIDCGNFIFKFYDKKVLNLILKKPNLVKVINQFIDELSVDLTRIKNLFDNLINQVDEIVFFKGLYKLVDFTIIKKKISNLKLDLLDEWIDYSKNQINFTEIEKNFIEISDSYNRGKITYEELFKAIYYNYLLKKAYDLYPDLTIFDGIKLDKLRSDFKKTDKMITELKKRLLFNNLLKNSIEPGYKHGQTKKCTELALINRIISQKEPRIKLRELIRKSSNALLDMMPCFIMSPTVLSELVIAKEDFFDILIIDEASQMRMENAISALARSKQCVIVGDQQQLPPNNSFELMEEENDEDDELVEESILDLANSRFRPNRLLRWHYRSKHESLINFSNHHFYNDQLVIPPSPVNTKAIKFNKIDAFYKGKINIQEKDKLISDLILFMKKNVRKSDDDTISESCLVVTMNIFQAELIEDDINRKKLDYPIIEEYINSWANTGEEFTVKNLENVQGDERDVIFVSTLFGPESPGKRVNQTFGPINNKGGQRRLNVLFTRARSNIHLYTSLNSSDIESEGAPEGRQVFKSYIEYAKTGRIETGNTFTGREPPNDFQIFIGEGIKKMGYDIVHEVGVSGFFIDIGVKHKSFPDGFIVGVECDGRAYHSSKSARDRDLLRQEILESLGWNIYRIWSTDWFKDSNKELKKLDNYIKGILKKIN